MMAPSLISRIDLERVGMTLSPHVESMARALEKEWPGLENTEYLLLHWLCMRHKLRPPTWWPIHVKCPVIKCESQPAWDAAMSIQDQKLPRYREEKSNVTHKMAATWTRMSREEVEERRSSLRVLDFDEEERERKAIKSHLETSLRPQPENRKNEDTGHRLSHRTWTGESETLDRRLFDSSDDVQLRARTPECESRWGNRRSPWPSLASLDTTVSTPDPSSRPNLERFRRKNLSRPPASR